VKIAVEGPVSSLGREELALILDRRPDDAPELGGRVRKLMEEVRERGDDALRAMAARYDGVELEALEVPRERWIRALEALDPAIRDALEAAAANVRAFHRTQLPEPLETTVTAGVRLGRRSVPLARVGVYAPGGRAAYPSSVLMGVVPARAAGVEEIVLCSPPGPSGAPPDAVLAAAAIAGADRLFSLGGAGAVAALTFGTATVPRVDAIVGPGNRWVTEAKRQVAGDVRIDGPAGPSEVLVVAEEGAADPELVAVELLAQAEHDPEAAVALVTPSGPLLERCRDALARGLAEAARAEVVAAALESRGALLLADDLAGALEFADRYAPEHLALHTRSPRSDLDRVRTAGTVFLGGSASVAFGDYMTGANHVLPTGGLSRTFSGLSVDHFLRHYTWQEMTPDAAHRMAGPVATLARAEGLPAHARAVELRSEEVRP